MSYQNSIVSDWVESCPGDIVTRVITTPQELEHLRSILHLYSEDTLVVVQLGALVDRYSG